MWFSVDRVFLPDRELLEQNLEHLWWWWCYFLAWCGTNENPQILLLFCLCCHWAVSGRGNRRELLSCSLVSLLPSAHAIAFHSHALPGLSIPFAQCYATPDLTLPPPPSRCSILKPCLALFLSSWTSHSYSTFLGPPHSHPRRQGKISGTYFLSVPETSHLPHLWALCMESSPRLIPYSSPDLKHPYCTLACLKALERLGFTSLVVSWL